MLHCILCLNVSFRLFGTISTSTLSVYLCLPRQIVSAPLKTIIELGGVELGLSCSIFLFQTQLIIELNLRIRDLLNRTYIGLRKFSFFLKKIWIWLWIMSAAKADKFFKCFLFFIFDTIRGANSAKCVPWTWRSGETQPGGCVKLKRWEGEGSSPAAARGRHGSPGGAGRPATSLIQLGEFCDASHGFCSSFAPLRSPEDTSHPHTAPKGQPTTKWSRHADCYCTPDLRLLIKIKLRDG